MNDGEPRGRPLRGRGGDRAPGRLVTASLMALVAVAVLAGGACASTSPAPSSAPDASRADDPDRGEADREAPDRGGPLDRAFIYEVGPEQARAVAADTASTLQVSGSAQVEVDPDRARVVFAVETRDTTAQGASSRNAERMASVMTALRETGMPGLEIETRGYSLRPEYRRPDSGDAPEIDAFRASNMVEAMISDPERVGALVDAAIAAGANRVTSLSFLAADTEEARLQALRDAVDRARREAEAIADALGMTLGEALEVTGGADSPPPPIPVRMEATTFQDSPTPVEPGSQTIDASVTIRYALREVTP